MPQISVDQCIGPAMSRTGLMLFQPFRLSNWLALALPAGLTLVGDAAFSSFNYNTGSRAGAGPGAGAGGGGGGGSGFDDALTWIRDHLVVVVAIGAIVLLLMLGFYLLLRWLNSRGQFMFFDNIVNHHYQIAAPWADSRELGNSLFKFRIGWDLIFFNLFLFIVVISLAIAGRDLYQAAVDREFKFTPLIGSAIVVLVISSLLFAVVRWIAVSILFHMAIPVMYIRRMHAWPAFKLTWRELFLPNKAVCILYFLAMIVVRIVQIVWTIIGSIVLCLVTLCIGYLAMVLPIVGNYPIALVSLPVLTFKRAYKLYFISQFGDEYRVHWQMAVGGGFPVILNPVASPSPSAEPPASSNTT